MSHPTNPFLKRGPDSSASKTRDEGLIAISQRLDQCSLEGSSVATDDGAPIFPGAADQSRRAAVAHGSSQVKPEQNLNLLHNQITTGRDTNLSLSSSTYNVTANLIQVVHNYEESGTAKDINSGYPESGRKHVDEDDYVAAGMLIPAPTSCILERDSQQGQIVAKLLSIPNAKVAILGMGGIGKTTLACTVANALEIEEAYPRRLFLSFEGCSTPDLAYTNLATAFQVPADRSSSHGQVLSHVLNYLKQEKTLLIIDNFETFWEVPSNRRTAEDFLAQLSALPKLALIVTLRGIQRPGNIRWIKMDPLEVLTPDASKELLSVITDEDYAGDSEYIKKILNAVAGVPLAVTLIGFLLRDNCETPRSLWHRWTRESTQAIGIANDADSDDRLYKLDVSLRLSIYGPRMSENAKELMASIAIIPIGLSMDDNWLDRLQDMLPSTISIRSCINTLRNVALCILEPASSMLRLKLLPPVRDFCLRNMPLISVLAHKLIDLYIRDLITHQDWGSSRDYTWVTMELSNISAILNFAITHHYVPDDFGSAVRNYTEWRRFLCIPDTVIVERAIDILSANSQAKAKCLQALGRTLSETSLYRPQDAIERLGQALSIHRKLEDKVEVGRDLYYLGDAYYQLDDYAHAEHYLSEARDLVTEIDDKWNKGSILETLAWIHLKQDKLPQAESAAKEALELDRTSGTRKGEVNALRILGRVYHEQGKYDLAVETLSASRDASQVIHDADGEACANESLGYVYRDANRPDKAALHFQLAISFFEKAQDFKWADHIRANLEKLEMTLDTP